MKKVLLIGVTSIIMSSFSSLPITIASPCTPSISIMQVDSVQASMSTDTMTFKLNGLACPAGIVKVEVDGTFVGFYQNYDVAGSFVIENNGLTVPHATQHTLTVSLYENMGGWPVFAAHDSSTVTTVPLP